MTQKELFKKFPFLDSKEIAQCRLVCYGEEYKEFIYVSNLQAKCGLFDKEGNIILPMEYEKISIFDDFIIADTFCSSTVYDYEGKEILSSSEIYRYVSYYGRVIFQGVNVGEEVRTKVYDKTGKEFEPGVVYEEIRMTDNEFLAVKFEGHWKILYTI